MKKLLSGNEAVARGLYEAGARFCSAYPGTPSTEILEEMPQYRNDVYCEWAPNEKVATEAAYGASIAGLRSFAAMKHVGLNVAADPVFTAAYNGVNAGFVLVSADDPSMHSSQNEQDNRWYAMHAKIPCVEPADSEECRTFVKTAYEISERFDTPVLLRMTTRVCHSKGLTEEEPRTEAEQRTYVKNVAKYDCAPANAYRNRAKLEKNFAALAKYSNTCPLQKMEINGTETGVIASGISRLYVRDAFPEGTSYLDLGLTNPLPMDLIREFASKVRKLYVVEELDGFMEMQIKAAGIPCTGKEIIPAKYELNPQIIKEAVFGEVSETKSTGITAAPRPPALCPGCPHRGFFYAAGKKKDLIITGDIGCYTLGAAAPLSAMDTCICMGGGFSIGAGIAKALELSGDKRRVLGIVGDSTFFHSGITGAIEAVYNNANIVPVVLDNHITGMTGHQENPGSGYTLSGEIAQSIAIEEILESVGFTRVIITDPYDLEATEAAIDTALASEERTAIICRRPCLLIKRIPHEKKLYSVDPDKCIGCRKCLKVGCPALVFSGKKSGIDATQCAGCSICAQVCPAGAISPAEVK